MEFPFGHHSHHHHHNRRDEEESGGFPQPPPPFSSSPFPPPHQPPFASGAYPPSSIPYGGGYSNPPPPGAYPPPETYPPPPVSGVYHSSHTPHLETPAYAPPPPSAGVISHAHSGHESSGHHHFQPHMPSFIEGHFHGHGSGGPAYGSEGGPLMGYFANKPTYRIYCKAGGDRYSVAVRDGKVILVQHNPDDPTQHWYKDEKYSTKVKDSDGYPSFSLVNKATGQAVKHSVAGHPVQLIPYKPDEFDESILWTESKDLGQGFRTIRMVNNVKLCMDAFHGDKDHGGVHDGTIVALYECWKGDNQNQQWKIARYCKPLSLSTLVPP